MTRLNGISLPANRRCVNVTDSLRRHGDQVDVGMRAFRQHALKENLAPAVPLHRTCAFECTAQCTSWIIRVKSAMRIEPQLTAHAPPIAQLPVYRYGRCVVKGGVTKALRIRRIFSEPTLPRAAKSLDCDHHCGYAPFSCRFFRCSASSCCCSSFTRAISSRVASVSVVPLPVPDPFVSERCS